MLMRFGQVGNHRHHIYGDDEFPRRAVIELLQSNGWNDIDVGQFSGLIARDLIRFGSSN